MIEENQEELMKSIYRSEVDFTINKQKLATSQDDNEIADLNNKIKHDIEIIAFWMTQLTDDPYSEKYTQLRLDTLQEVNDRLNQEKIERCDTVRDDLESKTVLESQPMQLQLQSVEQEQIEQPIEKIGIGMGKGSLQQVELPQLIKETLVEQVLVPISLKSNQILQEDKDIQLSQIDEEDQRFTDTIDVVNNLMTVNSIDWS
jgi:hypothetical protein